MKEPRITVTQELLKLIAEIDEFKGKWAVLWLRWGGRSVSG